MLELDREIAREENRQAIKDGLMVPDGYSNRTDYSHMLGRDLSCQEQHCYSVLNSNCGRPMTAVAIYREVGGGNPYDNAVRPSNYAGRLIKSIRLNWVKLLLFLNKGLVAMCPGEL